MAVQYFVRLPDAAQARASGDHAFQAQGAAGIAAELQDALRGDGLFLRWRDTLEDPDAVDPALGATDPAAVVRGEQDDLHIDLVAATSLSGAVFKHRLKLLAGSAWELRDVRAA